MPTRIASAAEIAQKWADVTPGRSAYYEAKAKVAGDDWEKGALASSKAFRAGVTAGNIEQRYLGGVRKAGAAKYNRKVADLGAARFSEGVRKGAVDYQSGFDPYVSVIAGVSPPAREPRGADANIERVRVYAKANAAKRLSLLGAGS